MTHPHDAGAAPAATMPLRAALAGAAAELGREQPPAWLERATLARLAPPAPQPPRRWHWFGGWPAAAALAGVLGVSMLLLVTGPAAPPAGLAAAGQPSGFLPLVGADVLAAATASPAAAWLVATEMPRERLAALGLPFDPARAGDNVPAELLMNASGQVLAVRVLPE